MRDLLPVYCNGVEIPSISKDANIFLNKSTVIYGPSETGKSTIIKDILNVIKDQTVATFLYTGSSGGLREFKNIIPKATTFDRLDVDQFSMLYKRQKTVTGIYERVNDHEVLLSLLNKLGITDHINIVKAIRRKFNALKKAVFSIEDISIEERKTQFKDIDKQENEMVASIYKGYIKTNRERLNRDKDLNDSQRFCLTKLDINPNITIIFDDFSTQLKNILGKKKFEDLEKFCYEGRHEHATLIYGVHTDTIFKPAFRQNTFVSIFSAPTSLEVYCAKTNSGLSKTLKKILNEIVGEFYKPENGKEHFRKICYVRNDFQNPIQYYLAKKIESLEMGSNTFREFLNEVSDKNNSFKIDDDFAKLI